MGTIAAASAMWANARLAVPPGNGTRTRPWTGGTGMMANQTATSVVASRANRGRIQAVVWSWNTSVKEVKTIKCLYSCFALIIDVYWYFHMEHWLHGTPDNFKPDQSLFSFCFNLCSTCMSFRSCYYAIVIIIVNPFFFRDRWMLVKSVCESNMHRQPQLLLMYLRRGLHWSLLWIRARRVQFEPV